MPFTTQTRQIGPNATPSASHARPASPRETRAWRWLIASVIRHLQRIMMFIFCSRCQALSVADRCLPRSWEAPSVTASKDREQELDQARRHVGEGGRTFASSTGSSRSRCVTATMRAGRVSCWGPCRSRPSCNARGWKDSRASRLAQPARGPATRCSALRTKGLQLRAQARALTPRCCLARP